MKKFIYTLVIGITMFIGVNGVEAENEIVEIENDKINVCTYNIGNVQLVVKQKRDNEISYGSTGEDNHNVYDGYSYEESFNIIDAKHFYENNQFKCNTIKSCKIEALTNDGTIDNIWFISATIDGDKLCGSSKEYSGKLSQEDFLNTETVCEYNFTIDGDRDVSLQAIYDSKKNKVKLKQDTTGVSYSDLIKSKIKVDEKIFLREGTFKCVPKSEIVLEQCINKKGKIGMIYWKSSSNNKLYCSGSSTEYINEIRYDDDNDNYDTKTFTQGQTVALIETLYNIIKIIIPVLIITLSIVDFLKVILISDDKNYKSAWDKFIKRLIIGIIFFLVPLLVEFILEYSGIGIEQSYTEIFK